MRKIRKLVFSLILALVLTVSLMPAAFAENSSVTFKGFSYGYEFKPGSEYTVSDMFDGFKNVMPGDTLTEEITFKNAASDCDFVKLYLRAESHDDTKNPISSKVAETETLASMNDFLSKLSMKVWNGTKLIYDASPDKTDGLTGNTYLCDVYSGESVKLTVELSVPITLGNEYANRLGEVDWVFLVEGFQETQLTVRKVWADGNWKHSGESVTVNLLKNGSVERTQVLNAGNNWKFTFTGLNAEYTWTVKEVSVTKGYAASYSTNGTTTVITNTKALPQTGLLWWPVPILLASGLLFVLVGVYVKRKGKKNEVR